MTNLVPQEEIETIVGAYRHEYMHLGKFDSETGIIYIMHPTDCILSVADLRMCAYSQYLDRGTRKESWEDMMDVPVSLTLQGGELLPTGKYVPAVSKKWPHG